MLKRAVLCGFLITAATASANAAEPSAAPCTVPADLRSTPFAAWTQPDADTASPLGVGRSTTLTPQDGAVSHALLITEAGRYGVAADDKVWIDVVADSRAIVSVDHGHGPACSGIRKIVWFDLAVGNYQLTLSKAANVSVRLLVVRAP